MNFYGDNLWEIHELDNCISLNIGNVPIFGIGMNLHSVGIVLFGFGFGIEW